MYHNMYYNNKSTSGNSSMTDWEHILLKFGKYYEQNTPEITACDI